MLSEIFIFIQKITKERIAKCHLFNYIKIGKVMSWV